MEGSSRLLDGWRGLLEGVGRQVNDQLKEALRGSQLLLGKQDQVTLSLLMLLLLCRDCPEEIRLAPCMYQAQHEPKSLDSIIGIVITLMLLLLPINCLFILAVVPTDLTS